MFIIDELNQILYVSSIVVQVAQPVAVFDAVSGVPFLLGSIFTFLLSFIIAIQFLFYNKLKNSKPNEKKSEREMDAQTKQNDV